MNTTGLFTVHEVRINAKVGQPITFIPFGDVHRDSDMHAESEWKEFLEHAKKKKNAIFLGMGDYTDGISTSERQVIGNGALHDTTTKTLEVFYKGVVKKLAGELAFMKGRLIGLLGGNHFVSFKDGSNSDNHLCTALDAKFLGVCSFIRLTIDCGNNHVATLDIFAHHGKGGGQTPGATFNTLEKMLAGADADIYLMGHDHRKGCIPSTPRIRIVRNAQNGFAVRAREPWLGRTGSFLKAYEPDQVSYNVDVGRPPCALGFIEFELTPMRKNEDGYSHVKVKIRGTS